MEILCIFLPAFISLFIYSFYINKKSSLFQKITYYVISVLVINFTILVLNYFRGIYSYLFTVSFSLKYLLLSFVLAIIIPIVFNIIYRKLLLNSSINNELNDFFEGKVKLSKIIKKKIIDNKTIFCTIFFSFIFIALFLSFDVAIRFVSNGVDSFYSYKNIGPIYMSVFYSIIFLFLILISNKLLRKILISLSYILFLSLFLADYFLIKKKDVHWILLCLVMLMKD